MMDFSPLAVQRRQGLGRVVKESSTIALEFWGRPPSDERSVTMSLPSVEVVSDRKFYESDLVQIWLDKDRIYLCNASMVGSSHFSSKSENTDFHSASAQGH